MNQDRPGKWSGEGGDHICAAGVKVMAVITCASEDEAVGMADMIADCVGAATAPVPEKKEE